MPGQADVQLQAMEDGPVRPDPDAMRAELKALLASWEYAFATGHGCSVGDHPRHRALRERVEYLRARIAEHST
jgi:hypothetical protein